MTSVEMVGSYAVFSLFHTTTILSQAHLPPRFLYMKEKELLWPLVTAHMHTHTLSHTQCIYKAKELLWLLLVTAHMHAHTLSHTHNAYIKKRNLLVTAHIHAHTLSHTHDAYIKKDNLVTK